MAQLQEKRLFTQANNRATSTETLRKPTESEVRFLPCPPQKLKTHWSIGFQSIILIGITIFSFPEVSALFT